MTAAPGQVDVLIPTVDRAAALAVTLTSLAAQTHRALRVVVSDQTEDPARRVARDGVVQAVVRVLEHRGVAVELHEHLPRRGLAEQRQFLLDQARASHVLFLDDDLVLEPEVVARLVRVMAAQRCGWTQALKATDADPVVYKVAWCAGCVLFDAEVLRAVGGFAFWADLPEVHAGEDVEGQLRVMARAGGCGVMPSGVFHQELPTTVPDRRVDVPRFLGRRPPADAAT